MGGSSAKILVIGDEVHVAEFRARFNSAEVYAASSHHEGISAFDECFVVFDFIIEEDPSQLHVYSGCKVPVFLNSVRSSLEKLIGDDVTPTRFFGFNGLPTFFNRPVLEVVVSKDADGAVLAAVCKQLKTTYEIAADQPGMVSARVVCMIVNEAFSTIEDGTASPEDIDLAMKLGTNYPRGPVEWGRQIGLKNVCEVLDALFQKTGNQRYTVCDLLREEARRE